jgi:hypothetical protein
MTSPRVDIRAQLGTYALSLAGAEEACPRRERAATVNGKVFVFLGHDDGSGPPGMTVKLVESREHALSLEGTTPSGYGLGRAGWVNVPFRRAHLVDPG